MNEMEALRIEEELQKQKVQQKHCNYNRHSKDSGVVDIELLRPSDFAINRHSTADCVSVGRAPISGSLVDMSECKLMFPKLTAFPKNLRWQYSCVI